VVAASVGGLVTAVRDGASGLLVADHEPASYATAFERVLLEPGLRDRLATGALEHARQFGWDRTAAAMIEVYAQAQEKMRADLTAVAL
jgi:D-inositol-3-phosphate glycosyltransferase